MAWTVRLAVEFVAELRDLRESVQEELLAHARLLAQFGPQVGRPRVDTLKGSRYSNMKELRFDAERGVWRVAFAFDARREAVLLAVGNKAGVPAARFYRNLIRRADRRLANHLSRMDTAATRH
jgi:hypothetical protein